MSSSHSPNKGLSKHFLTSINLPSLLVSKTSIPVQNRAAPYNSYRYIFECPLRYFRGHMFASVCQLNNQNNHKHGGWTTLKFTHDEDLEVLRAFAACKAHIAPTEETLERFDIAASKANATKKSSHQKWLKKLYRTAISACNRSIMMTIGFNDAWAV